MPTTLERMGSALFSGRAVGGAFVGIWLEAVPPDYDLIGGGITILSVIVRELLSLPRLPNGRLHHAGHDRHERKRSDDGNKSETDRCTGAGVFAPPERSPVASQARRCPSVRSD